MHIKSGYDLKTKFLFTGGLDQVGEESVGKKYSSKCTILRVTLSTIVFGVEALTIG